MSLNDVNGRQMVSLNSLKKTTRIVTEKGKHCLGEKAELLLHHANILGTYAGQYSQNPYELTQDAIRASLKVIDEDARQRGIKESVHRHNILSSNEYFDFPTKISTKKGMLSVCFYFVSFFVL
jgi:isocitrate dehydrogenase